MIGSRKRAVPSKRTGIVAAIMLAFAAFAYAGQTASAEPDGSMATAFVDVNVVPMTREVVLPGRTVLVRDGKIVAIGESGTLKPPSGARVINGRGRYLMPGLADMHTHIFRQDPNDALFLYLANGVTTIRNLAGSPRFLRLREEVEKGRTIGPRIFTSSPMLMNQAHLPGISVKAASAAEAEQRVREYKAAGYDYIKLHNPISSEAYLAAIAEGRRAGIPVVGHVIPEVGVAKSIDAGYASNEHFNGYSPRAPDPVLERLTVRSGIYNCPTLIAMWTNGHQEELLKTPFPEMKYLPPSAARANADSRRKKEPDEVDVAGYQRLLKRLDDQGAKLLTGTDTGIFAVAPGFSLHRELKLWAEAGLTPYRILRASTVQPAQFIGARANSGVIQVGRRADLVLLNANPLTDIANAAKIEGVMAAGRYLDRPELDRRLADIAARAAREP